jgi:sigma-B regulation protein RsbU (phosphoserine phosphatase)
MIDRSSPDPFRGELLERRRQLGLSAPHLRSQDLRALLSQVDAALASLDGGTFGLCSVCNEPMEAERMLADPVANVCLGCLTPAQARDLEHDLETAARIQNALLPEERLVLAGWEIDYRYLPLGVVSGDHCDLIRTGNGDDLYFFLGDVSGKGVSASILMATLHSLFRSLIDSGLALQELVAQANRIFSESTPASSYATLVAGTLSPSGRVTLCNAGHCPPLVSRERGVERVAATGVPLGLFSTSRFAVVQFDLEPDDLLFLYTDGLSEAMDHSGVEFGVETLTAELASARPSTAAQVTAQCLASVAAFRGGAAFGDDVTAMTVRRSLGVER